LIGLGIIKDQPGDAIELTPIRPGSSPAIDRLTRFERAQLQRYNDDVIAGFYLKGIVNSVWRDNFVDIRITAPKSWRDVYHYDDKGVRTGWTRYDGQKVSQFNADGLLMLDKGGLQQVKY